MIIKTDKKGKEIESWPTVEEAAKAIKLSPAVLKAHLKGHPKKLGGFIFKESAISNKQVVEDVKFLKPREPISDKLFNRDITKEELDSEIYFVKVPPESFDGPQMPSVTVDEFGMFPKTFTGISLITEKEVTDLVKVLSAPPVMLDEFGEVIPPIPEEAYGHTSVPSEMFKDIIDFGIAAAHIGPGGIRYVSPLSDEVLAALANARSNGDSFTEVIDVNPEEVADLLRTPLERRLHEIKNKK